MTSKIKQGWATLLGVALTFAVLTSVAPRMAQAESLRDMETAEAAKLRVGYRVASVDSLALNLTYVGSSTECVVTITTTVITAYAPAGTADSSNFGASASSYTLFSAAYDTMGELCDVIDALDDYNCSLLGAKRDDGTIRLRDQTATTGTNNLKASGGANFKFSDESEATTPTGNTGVYDIRVGITPNSGRRVMLKTCTVNANIADTVRVYGKLRKYEGSSDGVTRNDTTEVWRAVTADDTDKQIPIDVLDDSGFLEFGKDEHVVIGVGLGQITGVQAASNFAECLWYEK